MKEQFGSDLREGGMAFSMACRTIRRCTPNFLATPAIVPTPKQQIAVLDLLNKTVVTQSGQAKPNFERLTPLVILESVVNSEWRKREKEPAAKLKKWVDFERNRPPLHF